jgi:DNA-directed RNA polymerase specialized sigma24 family protein
MLGDKASAEDVVQDAFLGLYRNWARLSDPVMALVRQHATEIARISQLAEQMGS